ncbi:uncharacterized protein KQ657_001307 [Scheffersomyces spartinae]|uniref:Octanoyltransferase n=1 Tax=Scheffersomyces spartinae TaxID=45513 RepID=A0A9P8AH13_9ASCO|nr:uncharacterized protein KQ657_001307 [Scheffersomyces spartinae]KAG7192850.1 hypothetical protein KQ657_001307 [Scheffersomyces spartinae]
MIKRLGIRMLSTECKSRFYPLNESYEKLRHIHFPGITPFIRGEEIQKAIVSANLDFKNIEGKIRRQQKAATAEGVVINEYETTLLEQILAMRPHPTLLTFEFDNVYTGGKQMKQDPNISELIKGYEDMGCSYHQLERGGQVTWHGKGQLTAYTILDLKQFKNLTVKCFVDSVLLKAALTTLSKNYHIQTSTHSDSPGLYVANGDKIVSVGCNIQRAISSYGIGMNINPEMTFLNTFTMCGLEGIQATSVAKETGMQPSVKEIADQYAKEVALLLGIKVVEHMSGAELEV